MVMENIIVARQTYRAIFRYRFPVQALVSLTRRITVLILLEHIRFLNIVSGVSGVHVDGLVRSSAKQQLHPSEETGLQLLALQKICQYGS